MKKIIALFLISIFLVLFTDIVIAEELDIKTRWELYNTQKKYPLLAAGASIVPTLGHAYAGDWERGLPFLGAEIAGIALIVIEANEQDPNKQDLGRALVGVYVFFVATVWESIDAYLTADNFNEKLKEKYNLSLRIRESCPTLMFTLNL